MGLVGRFWSGKHKRVVRGIDLVALLGTDGDVWWPCDYRLVNPAAGQAVTKNDHFRELTVFEQLSLPTGYHRMP